MAEHKVSGGTMLLFIDPNGGTTYDTVVCLKSVGVSDSINPIDISSWCGSGKLPGLLNISYTFDGYHIQDVDTGRISGTDLRILLRNKTRIGWKISPESPVGGDEIQSGIGFISDLSSTYSFDSVGSFNLTVNVSGVPTTTIQPSFYVGMEYGGGIIAYIDETGIHGIIRNNGFESESYYYWSDAYNSSTYVGAINSAYGQGMTNTNLIVSTIGYYNAAGYCKGLTTGGFTDWFLPTTDEMYNIYVNGQIPSTMAFPDLIATSTEYDNTNCLYIIRDSGVISPGTKFYLYKILPCRYF